MITSKEIDLFLRNKNMTQHAFGGEKYPQLVTNADKDLYWDVYNDLKNASFNALKNRKLDSVFYVKANTYSKERGSRGHRPRDLWCGIRNNGSDDFNEMPQIYCIVSDRGVEIGFAVSIPEQQISDKDVKRQNRQIIPLIHKKLPTTGATVDSLDRFVQASPNWCINSSTRVINGESGFNKFTSVTELFNTLKQEKEPRGGGCIAKILSPLEILSNPVDLEDEIGEALDIFADIQKECLPSASDKGLFQSQRDLEQLSTEEFDPDNITDGKERKLRQIAARRGQPKFRKDLMEVYNSTCVISDCQVPHVVQAAHIMPYDGPETNKPDNGLLLRSDIHDLFDLKLVTIDPTTLEVLVSPSLKGTEYFAFNGKRINKPTGVIKTPSNKALSWHFREAKNNGL